MPPKQGPSFPMSSEEVIKYFGKQLSQFEKEEVMDAGTVYYLNLNSKYKGIGRYNHGELTCQDEEPPEKQSKNGIYNFGFDND